MYEKSSRNYPKNKKKMVPSKPDDFKNMLKITHVRGTEQGTQKNKKALFFARVSLRTQSNPSLDSASVSLRTKSNQSVRNFSY